MTATTTTEAKKATPAKPIKFTDGDEADLPVGSHEPCRLMSVTRHEPSEDNLAKWPDMSPSVCFKFKLYRLDSELHGHTCVRFVNESTSKLGHLYTFVCDLNDGEAPETFDPQEFVGRWFRVRVRKKDNGKLQVSGADPVDAPKDYDAEKFMQQVQNADSGGAGGDADDEDIPF